MSAQPKTLSLETFQRLAIDAYLECALWASAEEFDAMAIIDIAPESLATMRAECADFVAAQWSLIQDTGMYPEQCGHDYWLTRNGHGVGFWDRGYPVALGDALTRAAHLSGERDLYLGDDGKVWQA